MDILMILLYLAVMLTALPVGLLLAWLCRDELIDGKKWFKRILYIFVIGIIIGLLVYKDLPILLSLAYMIFVTSVSLYKGKDKKFVK